MPEDREKFRKLTVVELRELAREQLGRGTSRLRTKAQLIEALSSLEAQTPAERKQAAVPAASGKAHAKEPAAPGQGTGARPLQPAAMAQTPKNATALRAAPRIGRSTPGSKRVAAEPAAAPDPAEGARAPEPLVALPLDGQTLLVRWKSVPVRAKGERWEIEVSSDGQLARTVSVAPQARHVYVRALESGPVYRAKLVARDSNGRSRLVAALSRPVVFFPQPARHRSRERFVRYSWSDPVRSAASEEQPVPGGRLSSGGELAAGTQARLPTSSTGSLAGAPLGWLLGSRRPTSFAN